MRLIVEIHNFFLQGNSWNSLYFCNHLAKVMLFFLQSSDEVCNFFFMSSYQNLWFFSWLTDKLFLQNSTNKQIIHRRIAYLGKNLREKFLHRSFCYALFCAVLYAISNLVLKQLFFYRQCKICNKFLKFLCNWSNLIIISAKKQPGITF